MGSIHQGAGDHKEEAIDKMKVVEPFQKKTCSRSKTARRNSNWRVGTGDNGHVYKSDGLQRGAGLAAQLSFAVRGEGDAPLQFFHLFLCSFITSSSEPN